MSTTSSADFGSHRRPKAHKMTQQEANDIILAKSQENKGHIAVLIADVFGNPDELTPALRMMIVNVAVNCHTLGVMAGLDLSLENPEVAKVEL